MISFLLYHFNIIINGFIKLFGQYWLKNLSIVIQTNNSSILVMDKL